MINKLVNETEQAYTDGYKMGKNVALVHITELLIDYSSLVDSQGVIEIDTIIEDLKNLKNDIKND